MWPAVGARREGYDVQFVADACGTDTETGHQITLRRLESEGISLTTTAMLISELAGDLSTPQGTELLQIMLAR